MFVTPFCHSTGRHRLNRLHLAVLALGLALLGRPQPSTAQDLYTADASALGGGSSTQGPSANPVSISVGGRGAALASAGPGRLVANASSSAAGAADAGGSSAVATVLVKRFGLDPVQAGLMGTFSYHLVGTGNASASGPGTFSSGSFTDAAGSFFGGRVATFGASSGDADLGQPPSVTLSPADITGTANVLEVKGGQATINKAKAKVTDLSVEGLFSGKNLVSSGLLTIDNGGTLDATGAHVTVGDGGRLTVTGSGSRLFGFSSLEVNGLLIVNFGSALEGDALALSNNSSLQGTGTVKVNNKIVAAGQIKPGNSPGLLRIDGSLELTDTSELVLEMAGTAAGTEYNVLQVTGNLTLLGGHVNLAFINGFAPRQGQQFVLLDVSGSFQSSAAFGVTGLEAGWQFDTAYDPATGKLTLYSLSDGVSAVPEPAAWLFWGVGLTALPLRRRAA